MVEFPNGLNGGFGAYWARERDEKKPIGPEQIQTQTVRNGITYTRLKPGNADGCESAETWKGYNL